MWIRGWIGKWFDMNGIQRVMYNGAKAMRIETVSRASSSFLTENMRGSHDVDHTTSATVGLAMSLLSAHQPSLPPSATLLHRPHKAHV